jgi:hypothetical protein
MKIKYRRILLRQGFRLRQGYGGQDGGQVGVSAYRRTLGADPMPSIPLDLARSRSIIT